jgi:hypothetical protein
MILIFLAFLAGYAAAVVTGWILLNRPEHPRTREPVRYCAIGSGAAIDTSTIGAAQSDWSGPISNPPGSSPRGYA